MSKAKNKQKIQNYGIKVQIWVISEDEKRAVILRGHEGRLLEYWIKSNS